MRRLFFLSQKRKHYTEGWRVERAKKGFDRSVSKRVLIIGEVIKVKPKAEGIVSGISSV